TAGGRDPQGWGAGGESDAATAGVQPETDSGAESFGFEFYFDGHEQDAAAAGGRGCAIQDRAAGRAVESAAGSGTGGADPAESGGERAGRHAQGRANHA